MICIRIKNLRKYLLKNWQIELTQEKLSEIAGLKPRLISAFNTNPTHNAELESLDRLMNGVWLLIKKESKKNSALKIKASIFKEILNTVIEFVPNDTEFWNQIAKSRKIKDVDRAKSLFVYPNITIDPSELLSDYFIIS